MNEFLGKLKKSTSNSTDSNQFNSEEVEKDMDDLYTYLNTNLEVLNGYLDSELCAEVVGMIWSLILKDIEVLLLGEWEEEIFSIDAKNRTIWEEKRVNFTKYAVEV